MIILINGPFGVGKTAVAEYLGSKINNSLLFDPEDIGFFLRKVVSPVEQPADFQDLALWRTLTIHSARLFHSTYGRHLIVPMTIWREDFFQEILNGLRSIPTPIFHICLTASPATLYRRLAERGDGPDSFPARHVEKCLAAFQSPLFNRKINTEDFTVEEVGQQILKLLNFEIK